MMTNSINSLVGPVTARIEGKRADNLKKVNSNNIFNNSEFSKVLKQHKIKSINNNGWKTSPQYLPKVSDVKQKIEAAEKNRAQENGTDFALKELSCQFEEQILGILWNMAFSTIDKEFEGGLGEELFQKELVNEMVKLSETGEMGEIAQNIYNDLKSQSENTN